MIFANLFTILGTHRVLRTLEYAEDEQISDNIYRGRYMKKTLVAIRKVARTTLESDKEHTREDKTLRLPTNLHENFIRWFTTEYNATHA